MERMLSNLPGGNHQKVVIVVDGNQPRWLVANSSAVLGVAMGGHGVVPLGPDVKDRDGDLHPGIGTVPIPILEASQEVLKALRSKAQESDLIVLDFNSAAHRAKKYDEYEKLLGADEIQYLALALIGPKGVVGALTRELRPLA